ncbi:MAG: GtrA family protein [Bacteroidales bacterium]|jgi:putative flippase GtrA|nr:GtrA family protein [Bacteroidales bacterium]
MQVLKDFINKLLFEKTDNILIQLFRYTFVGGTAFLVDFGLLFFLKEICGLHYILSATISFIFGLIVNYVISVYWVFTNKGNYNRKTEFLYFAIIGIIGLGFNDLFMWLFTDKFKIYYLLSKIISAVLVYLWNFFARRYFLFNNNKVKDEVKG